MIENHKTQTTLLFEGISANVDQRSIFTENPDQLIKEAI